METIAIIAIGLIFLLVGITSITYNVGRKISGKNKKSKPVKPSFFEWDINDKLKFFINDEQITVWLYSFFGDEIVVFTKNKQNKCTILRWDEKLGCFTDGETELEFIENNTLIDRQQTRRLEVIIKNHKLFKESVNEIKSIDDPLGNYINYEETRNSTN